VFRQARTNATLMHESQNRVRFCLRGASSLTPIARRHCACLFWCIGWYVATTSAALAADVGPAATLPAPAANPVVAPITALEAEPAPTGAALAVSAAPTDPMLVAVDPAPRTLSSWFEAMDVIKARSLDLRIAVLDVAKAEAQSRTALAGILPSLNAGTTYNHQLVRRTTQSATIDGNGNPVVRSTTTPTADTLSASLSASMPIVNAPAWYAIGTAGVSEEIARLSVEDLKRRLTLGVANAIVAVVTAERVAELNRNGLANALTRQQLTTAKFRNGVATTLDLERANQDVISTRSSVLNGDESLRQAREALGLALGFSEAVGVRPDLSLDALLNDTRTSCRTLNHLKERADFAVLEKKRELSQRQITNVKLQFVPTLNLSSGLGATTPKSAIAPPVTWNIQAVLNWAIWDGGARYGSLRSARAAAEQADANRDALERSATIDVLQARRAVTVATNSVAVSKQARDAAAQIDEMTQKMFRAGMATSLELVVAATALRQAEINLATQQFALVQTQIAAAMTLASCPW
jgi:outer membrane protein, multidrug efflux system